MLRTLKQAHRIGFTVQIPYSLPLKTMVYIWKYAETAPITSTTDTEFQHLQKLTSYKAVDDGIQASKVVFLVCQP